MRLDACAGGAGILAMLVRRVHPDVRSRVGIEVFVVSVDGEVRTTRRGLLPVDDIHPTVGAETYRRSMGYCRCCGLDNAIFSARKAFNDLPQAAIVCDLCARHQGSDAHDLKKALKVHRDMAAEHERERVELLTERHEAKLAERDSKIAELEEELDARPVQVVEKWVDADVLHEAHAAATAAYRSRDHAFRQMCLLHMKHHEVTGERCSCRRSIADCDVVGILEGFRALLRWERKQEERRDQGLSHQLPWEYVEYLGGTEPGDDPHEFDPYAHETGS